jgi:hypothetical protein
MLLFAIAYYRRTRAAMATTHGVAPLRQSRLPDMLTVVIEKY